MIDDPVVVTFFTDHAAITSQREVLALKELAGRIAITSAPSKDRLPWLKLSTFGDVRSPKGSLRHDGNMIALSGIEIDYDGELVTLAEAVERVEKEGLEALIYTSPSHMRDGHGSRWRILFPFAEEHRPEERERFVGRVAGLFRDGNIAVLAGESWSRSQAYYFGAVDHNREHRVKLTEGQRLDHPNFDELDLIALPKPARLGTPADDGGPHQPGRPEAGIEDIRAALNAIPNDWVAWKEWNRLALATYAASGGSDDGQAAFREWSQQNEAFDATETKRMWHHMHTSPPSRSGFGSLVFWARQADRDFVLPSQRARDEAKAEGLRDLDARLPPPDGDKSGGNPSAGAIDDDYDTQTNWVSPDENPWPEIDSEAFHGLAGQIVDAIVPNSESDPIAILTHFLIEFGNAAGRHSYCVADGARHYPNEYAVIVGDTSKARKGTAARRTEQVMGAADSDWRQQCIASGGLSSGEGIIHAVHDDITSQEKISTRGQPPKYVTVIKYPSITDKRLFIDEPEFAGALTVMKREGNTLSRVVRMAWDNGNLRTLTKNNPEKATGAHVSIVGHITLEEYRLTLDRVSMVNGYANRFLNVLVRRHGELPFGGALDDATVAILADRVRAALGNTALRRQITFTPEASELWVAEYHTLSMPRPGLFGGIVARGEAHALRLALLYALLDERRYIDPAHLRAALAFWRYCEASAKYIFGDAVGEPVADAILDALRRAGSDGMTRSQISELFGRNKSSGELAQALRLLLKHGKARLRQPSRRAGRGRTPELWIAC
jgi:hypothetical protein